MTADNWELLRRATSLIFLVVVIYSWAALGADHPLSQALLPIGLGVILGIATLEKRARERSEAQKRRALEKWRRDEGE